jgi:hypothetical protein
VRLVSSSGALVSASSTPSPAMRRSSAIPILTRRPCGSHHNPTGSDSSTTATHPIALCTYCISVVMTFRSSSLALAPSTPTRSSPLTTDRRTLPPLA